MIWWDNNWIEIELDIELIVIPFENGTLRLPMQRHDLLINWKIVLDGEVSKIHDVLDLGFELVFL